MQPEPEPVNVGPAPPTLREDEFRLWLRWEIDHHKRIPTPTACLRYLGRKVERTSHAQGGPTMSGMWSKIRIEVFTGAGLVKRKGYWRFP